MIVTKRSVDAVDNAVDDDDGQSQCGWEMKEENRGRAGYPTGVPGLSMVKVPCRA
jgi:hypothetical protein